jgi:hypothetical protein
MYGAVIAAATVLLITANASAAPTLALEPDCYKSASGEQVYGVQISVTGLSPNAQFTGRLEYAHLDGTPNGGIGPAVFTADANGSFAIGFGTVGIKTIYTATVVYEGQTLTKTITVTCEPTTTADCKNGGWRSYGIFKSQGDCVSFVATKGKNP